MKTFSWTKNTTMFLKTAGTPSVQSSLPGIVLQRLRLFDRGYVDRALFSVLLSNAMPQFKE